MMSRAQIAYVRGISHSEEENKKSQSENAAGEQKPISESELLFKYHFLTLL